MRRLSVVPLVLAAAVATAAAALAAQSPQARLAAIRKAVYAAHSVHYVSRSAGVGHTVRMVSDVGAGEGIQRIAVSFKGRSGHGDVLIVKRTAYLRGDAYTLQNYFGFTQAQASRYAGKWISIPHSRRGYATVAADATFASYASGLFPRTKLSLVRSGSELGVRGEQRQLGSVVLETLMAPSHGNPLPTRATYTFPGHPGTGLTTMSRWNEPLRLTTPSHAVPVSKVVGG